jgi:hypothetical protein
VCDSAPTTGRLDGGSADDRRGVAVAEGEEKDGCQSTES